MLSKPANADKEWFKEICDVRKIRLSHQNLVEEETQAVKDEGLDQKTDRRVDTNQ